MSSPVLDRADDEGSPTASPAASPTTNDPTSNRYDLIGIPLKPFELAHMRTYQPDFMYSYAKAQIYVELETTAAQIAHREVRL